MIGNLTLTGRAVRAGWGRVKLVAREADTVADRVVQRIKTRLTRVESADLLHAGNVQQKVDEVYSVGSKHTFVKATRTVKVDGDQIIMG